jgi:hypothetical protein
LNSNFELEALRTRNNLYKNSENLMRPHFDGVDRALFCGVLVVATCAAQWTAAVAFELLPE